MEQILYQDSIPTFETILQLRTYQQLDQGNVVYVGGRTSIGDGYGSSFIYDSTSTQLDDGEYVIRPNAIAQNGSGRWLVNGWGYLADKMNANNKDFTGINVTSSTITNTTISNSTLSTTTTDATTDWTTNKVVGALDVSNRFETIVNSQTGDANTLASAKSYTDTSSANTLASAKSYTDTQSALKANLAGGNTFTGNQNIAGNLVTTGTNSTNGTLQVTQSGTNALATLTRKNGFSVLNSYDGSNWHPLSINDDDTVDTAKGQLAFESDVALKANLAGGNTFTGQQNAVNGANFRTVATDGSFCALNKYSEATTKGAVLRYNDTTTSYDWIFGTNSITTPSGNTISDAGDIAGTYATIASLQAEVSRASSAETSLDSEKAGLSANNTFTGTNYFGNTVTVDSHDLIVHNSDILTTVTNGSNTNTVYWYTDTGANICIDSYVNSTMQSYIRVNSSGVITTGGGTMAFTSQLPFYGQNTGQRIQAFQVQGTGTTTISFPIAFASGTTPTVTAMINLEPNSSVYRGLNFTNTGTGNTPNITNTGFTFVPFFANAGNQAGASGRPWTLHVIAVGTY